MNIEPVLDTWRA